MFLDIYLLRFSSFPGRVNVPADFDTIEKAFSGVKTAEGGINKGFRGQMLTSKALVCFIQLLISAVPKSGGTEEFKTCGVRISE